MEHEIMKSYRLNYSDKSFSCSKNERGEYFRNIGIGWAGWAGWVSSAQKLHKGIIFWHAKWLNSLEHDDQNIWVWVNTYRYIFSGMNIHKSQLFWGSPGVPGFWPIAMWTPSAEHWGEESAGPARCRTVRAHRSGTPRGQNWNWWYCGWRKSCS